MATNDATLLDPDRFRFHTGSIKRLGIAEEEEGAIEVSIPYWFD